MTTQTIKEKVREDFLKFDREELFSHFYDMGKTRGNKTINWFLEKIDSLYSTFEEENKKAVEEREEEIINILEKESKNCLGGSGSFDFYAYKQGIDKSINLIKSKNENTKS